VSTFSYLCWSGTRSISIYIPSLSLLSLWSESISFYNVGAKIISKNDFIIKKIYWKKNDIKSIVLLCKSYFKRLFILKGKCILL
jgi:hypothetical protein